MLSGHGVLVEGLSAQPLQGQVANPSRDMARCTSTLNAPQASAAPRASRRLVFTLVDGHRGVRCLVRVDADHHFHDYLSLEPRGHSACGRLVLDPLLSHSVAKTWRETLRKNANRLTPAAGTLRVIPPGTIVSVGVVQVISGAFRQASASTELTAARCGDPMLSTSDRSSGLPESAAPAPFQLLQMALRYLWSLVRLSEV